MKKNELANLEVIRVETALSRFPIHRLAKSGAVRIELQEKDERGATTFKWRVSYNSEFGQPGPLAYRIDTLIVNRRIEEATRPIPRILKLGSLSEACRELGLADSGKNRSDIKRALHQNASTYVTAKIRYKGRDSMERTLEAGFTRYHVVFTGEKLPDGRTANAVYLVLSDIFMQVIDGAQTRPLDYDRLRELQPTSQRWYELASYAMYAALKNNRPRARLIYSEFCRYAPQSRCIDYDRMKRQMWRVHTPHRKSGYIAEVEFEPTTDREGRPDWVMLYRPGPKARAEYRAFTRKGGPAVLEAEPVKPEPGPEPTGLAQALVDHGVTPSTACELVATYPEDRIRAQIEHVDGTRRKIRDKAAYLVSAIQGNFATKAVAPPTEAEPAKSPDERSLQAQAQDRAEQLRMRRFWEGLSPAEREAFNREALAHADPEQRGEYDRQDDPRLRRLHLTPIRDAHIRARLAAG